MHDYDVEANSRRLLASVLLGYYFYDNSRRVEVKLLHANSVS